MFYLNVRKHTFRYLKDWRVSINLIKIDRDKRKGKEEERNRKGGRKKVKKKEINQQREIE